MTPITVLLMAAGISARFGSDKRKARLEDGTTLLAKTAGVYREIGDRRIAVLRGSDRIDRALHDAIGTEYELHYVETSTPSLGTSIASAVARVERGHSLLVALADMPSIRPDTVKSLLVAAQGLANTTLSLRPTYQGNPGHPVIIGAQLVERLGTVDGSRGARALLRDSGHQTMSVEDPGVIADIDFATSTALRSCRSGGHHSVS